MLENHRNKQSRSPIAWPAKPAAVLAPRARRSGWASRGSSMATELFANNYTTTLNGTISNSATTVVMGSAVPTALRAVGQWRLLIDSELMLVTAVNVDNVTLTVS